MFHVSQYECLGRCNKARFNTLTSLFLYEYTLACLIDEKIIYFSLLTVFQTENSFTRYAGKPYPSERLAYRNLPKPFHMIYLCVELSFVNSYINIYVSISTYQHTFLKCAEQLQYFYERNFFRGSIKLYKSHSTPQFLIFRPINKKCFNLYKLRSLRKKFLLHCICLLFKTLALMKLKFAHFP